MEKSSKLYRLISDVSPAHKAARKLQGLRDGPISYSQKAMPYCDSPVPLERYERGEGSHRPGAYVLLHGPCRKCEKCRLFNRLQWRDRIRHELEQCQRSWFVTLTFEPGHLAGIIAESQKLHRATEQERVEVAAYAHVQQYLKRIRKTGGRFRYFATAEYGSDNGRLHYHLLMHEQVLGSLTYRVLDTKWRSFVQANLVRSSRGAAGYVSKYLTKAISKPRASVRYGKK